MPGKAKMLTPDNVNQLAREILSGGAGPQRVALLKKDWRTVVSDEFRLTKQQKDNLHGIPSQVVEQIKKALGEAADRDGEVQVLFPSNQKELSPPGAVDRGKLTILGRGATSTTASDVGLAAFTIPIIECSFDADCGNWQCGPPSPL